MLGSIWLLTLDTLVQSEQAHTFYGEHHGKNFYDKLVDFMTR